MVVVEVDISRQLLGDKDGEKVMDQLTLQELDRLKKQKIMCYKMSKRPIGELCATRRLNLIKYKET